MLICGSCTLAPPQHKTSVIQSERTQPLQQWNRGVYRINRLLDKTILRPVHFLFSCLPSLIKKGIYHFLLNMERPISIVNSLLQLNVKSFAEHTACFVFNSTLGLAGFFDVADSWMKLHPEHIEFGDTLHKFFGMPKGPLIMMPVLGPFRFRDFLSRPVDFLTLPITYFDQWIYFGTKFVENKSRSIDIESAMEKSFRDPYAIIESLYEDKKKVDDDKADASNALYDAEHWDDPEDDDVKDPNE